MLLELGELVILLSFHAIRLSFHAIHNSVAALGLRSGRLQARDELGYLGFLP